MFGEKSLQHSVSNLASERDSICIYVTTQQKFIKVSC